MISRARLLTIKGIARTSLIERDLMTLPVEPKQLAKALDITVEPFDFGKRDISGCLMNVGGSFAICYSTSIKSLGFQNFTIAHELGHYLIPGHYEAVLSSGRHFSSSGFISADTYEEEADAFASELLMPWKLIETQIRAKRPGFESIKAISESCNSSLVASAIKFCEHSKECVAAVVSLNGTIEFMTASDSFKQLPNLGWLRRGQSIPVNVPSAVRSSDEEWITACGIEESGSMLHHWFPNAPRIEVEEDIVGLGSYGRILTVLLAEWDQEEEEEEEGKSDDWIERMNKGYFRGKR